MRLQVTLALICVLFPQALALKCYQCIPGTSRTCTDTQVTCPDKCGSATLALSAAGQVQQISTKECAAAADCVSGSLNLGLVKMTLKTECCSTDLCNSNTAPALPFGSPNGRQCHSCTGNDCTGSVSCDGDEDQCISAKVDAAGTKVTMKGCVSKSLCTADASALQAAGVTDLRCCSGNLCNGAEGVKLSLLFMLVPLISSILFL